MTGLGNSEILYLEIGQDSLKALNGERGLELPLERRPDGRLTDSCRAKVTAGLQGFLNRKSWQSRLRAYCAIGARGVSLRHITLPAAGREEFQRLLLMQIESEFPLPPDQLAWGYHLQGESRQNGVIKQELVVMAVKRGILEEYSSLLVSCGINATFTLAALARSGVCPPMTGSFAVLDIGAHNSELAFFDGGVPAGVRVFPWGDEHKEARDEALDALAKSLNGDLNGRKMFVSAQGRDLTNVLLPLAHRLGGAVECELLNVGAGEGRSSATLGLRKTVEDKAGQLLPFQSLDASAKSDSANAVPLKWAVLAGALLLALLVLPYAKAVLLKPWLERKYNSLQTETGTLATIDRELGFLQYLRQNQPPYLDAMYLLAKFAPSGSKIDSLTMNRHGDVSLRGSMRNADQVAEFRSKLIDSGFFASVSVEEQTPTPDRQKVNLRMTARWKDAIARQALAIGPTKQEIDDAKNRKDSAPGGMPPGFMPGAMHMGMPVGAMPAGVIHGGAMPPGLPPGIQASHGAIAKPPLTTTVQKN